MTVRKEVTLKELVGELLAINGAQPATLAAKTTVKMNKRNNPFYDRVEKLQVSNVFLNFDYAKSINKRLVKEGKEPNFEAKPRAWGVHLPGTKHILTHKDSYYLSAGFLTKNQPKVTYLLDGEETEKEVFENHLKSPSSSKSQGLDEEVVFRTFNMDSILELKVNGVHYVRTDV